MLAVSSVLANKLCRRLNLNLNRPCTRPLGSHVVRLLELGGDSCAAVKQADPEEAAQLLQLKAEGEGGSRAKSIEA